MSLSSTTLVLAPDLSAVRAARAFVTEACRHWRVADIGCDDAGLMVSELVTNAFLHGRSDARISVSARPGPGLRVEVGDDNSRHPRPVDLDDDALDGRGLAIVEALSSSWGVRDEPLGKTVWFEV